MGTPEGMITVQDVAKRLGRSLEQVRRYLRAGKLTGERIGNQWFIREGAVMYEVGRKEEEEMAPSGYSGLRTIREMSAQERWEFLERVNRRREEIRQRWEKLGIEIDAVEVIREIREEEP